MNTTDKRNPGNGFIDHGVATPISNHRGIVATVDGDGRDVALVWLFDHRGGYALLMVDADTGQSHEIPVPFPCGGDCPYASILSSRNLFYSHYNGYFVEFDTAQRAFTFVQHTFPQMAMGMTEDDRGRIWSVTYPDSGVVCFDPETRELRDYGSVHQENWQQYQRYVAADDTGWIYFALGNTASQIIMLDPESGEATPVLPEEERVTGPAYLYRDLNGKVYGQALEGAADGWYELYQGKATKIGTLERKQPKPIITSSQGLFHDRFPDGRILKRCDLTDRVIAVEDPATGKVREHAFDYSTDGAHIMGLAAAPDGTVCGGTAFPMRFFSFNPRTGAWINRPAYLQFNTVARQGDRFFFGGYIHGFLLEWDPSRPWVDTVKGDPNGNPRWLIECEPDINRPHKLLAHPDGKTLVLAGTPGYGYTGGGLLFWDRETETGTLVRHTEILPEHSTMSLVALPGGKLLGGSTTDPGTGGERKAKEAELYVMDMASKRVEWHEAVIPGVQGYVDMCLGANGVVYGIADGVRFFAFDPTERRLLHIEETEERFGPTGYQQGQRKLVQGPDGALYALFLRAITRVNLETHQPELLIEPPVPVQFGGDILDGRLYFAAASHLYSWALPE
ncbi:MAG: NHL repeat-containing protein [Armatimonadota bacterium]